MIWRGSRSVGKSKAEVEFPESRNPESKSGRQFDKFAQGHRQPNQQQEKNSQT